MSKTSIEKQKYNKFYYECNKEKLSQKQKDYRKNKIKNISKEEDIQRSEKYLVRQESRKNYKRKLNMQKYSENTIKINNIRKNSKCEICGFDGSINDNWAALIFHHKDRNTKYRSVSSMKTFSWGKIQEEINKCIIICANCHKILHKNNNKGK